MNEKGVRMDGEEQGSRGSQGQVPPVAGLSGGWRWRAVCWALGLVALVLVLGVCQRALALTRWELMWALAIGIYGSCKVFTFVDYAGRGPSTGLEWLYVFLWPGMDAERFFTSNEAEAVGGGEWVMAWLKLFAGVGIFYGALWWVPPGWPYVMGWAGMVGLALALHCGVFHVLSCAYRSRGIDARRVMDSPGLSCSVGEFWGRRWNTAFRDLAHRYLFKPLSLRLGAFWGLWAGFLFSGVVHDLVISCPAGGGYGGPTAYFLIQALGLVVERASFGRRLGLGRGAVGWVWTMAVVIGPAGLLFHHAFVERVMVAFMYAAGGR